jgi:hypothetical protein
MRVAKEHTQEASPGRGRIARAAATVELLLAAGALLSIIAKVFLEGRWALLMCGDTHTQVLDRLVFAALVCSIVAVATGIATIAGHTQHKRWVVLGMVVAGAVVTLIVVPDALGGYQCGIMTP